MVPAARRQNGVDKDGRVRLLVQIGRDRRLAGLALAAFVWGTLVLPLVHNIEHHDDHSHHSATEHQHASPIGVESTHYIPIGEPELTDSHDHAPPFAPAGSGHHDHGDGALAHLGVMAVAAQVPQLAEPSRVAELLPELPSRSLRLTTDHWITPPARAPPG